MIPDPHADPPRAAGASAGPLPRRATADPHRYLIPRDQLPPGFADRLDSGAAPVAPRPAATVVLVRDAPDGPEVLLLRRHNRSGFAADAWVFPGGVVDPADADPALPVLCDGPPPDEWAETLGLADAREAFGYVIAALREAFEETGILLARVRLSESRSPAALPSAAQLAEYRDALLAGRLSLRALAVEAGLQYATDQLLYLAHWITPEPEPRRYDTRFFLAPLPEGAACVLHEPELVEASWRAPGRAVERFLAGEWKMLPPTVHTLKRLARFRSVAQMRDGLRSAPVPAILPEMRRHPEGIAIEIPSREEGERDEG